MSAPCLTIDPSRGFGRVCVAVCAAAGEMSCDVKVRLNVLLPEVRFVGTWRLESKSWNAAQELPGMVDMIQSLQGQGLSYAMLTLQPRKSVSGGQTHNFVIPVLGIPASLEQLAAGEREGRACRGVVGGAVRDSGSVGQAGACCAQVLGGVGDRGRVVIGLGAVVVAVVVAVVWARWQRRPRPPHPLAPPRAIRMRGGR